MKIALIGAGNLATRLGLALVEKGQTVAQVYSRTEASAQALGKMLQCPATTVLADVCTDADLYVLAVKDAAFADVAAALVPRRRQALFVHTAGSLPMSVWEGIAPRHGVFYPMQTFSKLRSVDFSSIPIFIEANNAGDLDCLKALAATLSGSVFEADSRQRRALHLAAVFACNFTNHMYAVCGHLLDEAGLPFDVMLPLIDETAAKVHDLSPSQAQTGPAVRYDENVITRHLEALAVHPEWQDLYERISKSIHHDKLRFDQNQGSCF